VVFACASSASYLSVITFFYLSCSVEGKSANDELSSRAYVSFFAVALFNSFFSLYSFSYSSFKLSIMFFLLVFVSSNLFLSSKSFLSVVLKNSCLILSLSVLASANYFSNSSLASLA